MIEKKKEQAGTKIQMKPGFKKEKKEKKEKEKEKDEDIEEGEGEKKEKDLMEDGTQEEAVKGKKEKKEGELEKMQLILKWGGEVSNPTRLELDERF